MEMIGKIRRMYLRDRLSLHEITKRTGLSRNTIRKWLRSPKETAPPTYRRSERPCKLSAFHDLPRLAGSGRQDAASLRPAEVCTGRGVPVRLERRRSGDRRHLPAHPGIAPQAVRQPCILAGRLPEPRARNAVRRAHAILYCPWRNTPARHLRQHEDSRR